MFSIFYHDHKDMSFMTFVLDSLCPKGNNDLKDEGVGDSFSSAMN